MNYLPLLKKKLNQKKFTGEKIILFTIGFVKNNSPLSFYMLKIRFSHRFQCKL